MISKIEVEKIARLARLELSEDEIKKMQKDLSAILDYFNLLKKADTQKIKTKKEPLGFLQNIVREDKVVEKNRSLTDDLVKMAPDRKERHIKVRTIL